MQSRAVQWLEDLHLLDDAKTAEQIVHSCIAKGYGLARAKQALYEKRIPKAFWEDALADYPTQNEKITAFLQGKGHRPRRHPGSQAGGECTASAGHSYGAIRQALNNLSLDSDDFPEDE